MSERRRHRLGLLMLALTAAMWAGAAGAQTVSHSRLTVEAYAVGLEAPTGFVFLADDDVLVIEKNTGRVRRVRNGAVDATVLDLQVSTSSERGGLGIELSPDFTNDGFVYIYYSAATGGDNTAWTQNVVARYRWNGTRLVSPAVLLTFPSRTRQANGPNHDGGTLRFGRDGNLYGQVGDLNRGGFGDPRIEQNTGDAASAEVGGIFRIDGSGNVPADNPFATHAVETVRKWFVYGVRNGFGLAVDSLTGRLWFTENGPEVYDEINVAESGMNSGWLPLMGPDSRDARYGANGNRAFDAADLVMLPGSTYRDPQFSWLDPIGVTALVFLRTDTFPRSLRDLLVVGDTNTGDLYLFQPRGRKRRALRLAGGVRDRVADTELERQINRWGSDFGIVTDMRMGPDENLYVLDLTTGTLWRIRPKS